MEAIEKYIKRVERILDISINGNQQEAISEQRQNDKFYQVLNDAKIYLNDGECVQKYFPQLFDESMQYEDPEGKEYELRINDVYIVYTKDGGEVKIDFGSIHSDHGDYESIDVVEESEQAEIVHDWLTNKEWNTDDLSEYFIREISNAELASLSSDWENPTVDTRKYYQNVFKAYEVSERLYWKFKADGVLCQKHKGNYYIA